METTGGRGEEQFVSVVIANHNRCHLLLECLESLARQTWRQFEVIVVDNGSEDGSVEAARSHLYNYFQSRSLLIENKENFGFCRANNQGIAAARGEYIALLNNDAVAEPGWLAALLPAFADKSIGMAASKIVSYDNPNIIDKAGHLIYPDGQNRGRGTGAVDCGQYDRVEEALWPDGCAAMYRKSMLEEIGGFDEDLFAYADDAELGLRARIAGWRCLYMPAAVVRHRRGATLGILSPRRIELIERNRILLVVKHFPPSMLFLHGFYFVARVAAGAFAASRGTGEAAQHLGFASKLRLAAALLKGECQALPMIPRTLRKRKALRSLRRLSGREIRALLYRFRISLRELSSQAI